jgi:hypothetical protein
MVDGEIVGFNGAAITRSPKFPVAWSAKRTPASLQWGGDHAIAEMRFFHPHSGPVDRFNGAAITRSPK